MYQKPSSSKEFGVFLPVANGGWIISETSPPLDDLWTQNRAAAVTADEVGNVAAFLCSDLASGITGEVTYVDAGFRMMGFAEGGAGD